MNNILSEIEKRAGYDGLVIGMGMGANYFDHSKVTSDVVLMEADELIESLKEGKIQAAVRGGLPAREVLDKLKKSFSISKLMRAVLMEVDGRPIWFLPVGIDEGGSVEDKDRMIWWLVSWGFEGKVGVLSKGRLSDGCRGDEIARSLEQGNELVSRLGKEKIKAAHYGILLEEAVKEVDAIVCPDGVTGNIIFRSLHLVARCRSFGAPVLNLQGTFIDTSSSKEDFTDPLCLAAYMATRVKRKN